MKHERQSVARLLFNYYLALFISFCLLRALFFFFFTLLLPDRLCCGHYWVLGSGFWLPFKYYVYPRARQDPLVHQASQAKQAGEAKRRTGRAPDGGDEG